MTASEPPDEATVGTPDTPSPPPEANLTARTVRGLKWTYLGTALVGVMQLTYTAVMSRLLTPRLFGVFAVASLAVMFGQYFAQMGLGHAVVQKDQLSEDEIRASWTSSVLLGIAVTIVGVLTAPAIGAVFDEPDAVPVLQVMSLSYLILGFEVTARGLLRRQMRFRAIATAQTAGFFGGFILVGIGMAVAGAGVWSLVGANLGSRVVGSSIKYLSVRHTVRPIWRWTAYRDLYAFGVRSSGIQLLEFASNNLDTIAVARFATANILGQYNRAFYLVNLPLAYLRDSLAQVLFPGFSRLQHDRARLRTVFTGASGVAAAIVLPLCAGVAAASPDIVGVVMGDQWEPASRVVPWLAIAAALSVMSRFAGIAIEAVADLNRKLVGQSLYVVVLAGLMLLVGGRAIWWYGVALAIGELLRSGVFLWLMRGAVTLRLNDVARIYLPAGFAAALVGGAIAGVRWVLVQGGVPLYVRFAAELVTGALMLLVALRTTPLARVRDEMRMRLTRSGSLDSTRIQKALDLAIGKA